MDPNCLVTLLLYPKLFYDVDVDDMKMDGEKIGRCLFWFRLFFCVFFTPRARNHRKNSSTTSATIASHRLEM